MVMESIKLNFEVNNIKVNPAQLKAVQDLSKAFTEVKKATSGINTSLNTIGSKTQTLLNTTSKLNSEVKSVNGSVNDIAKSSERVSANFKSLLSDTKQVKTAVGGIGKPFDSFSKSLNKTNFSAVGKIVAAFRGLEKPIRTVNALLAKTQKTTRNITNNVNTASKSFANLNISAKDATGSVSKINTNTRLLQQSAENTAKAFGQIGKGAGVAANTSLPKTTTTATGVPGVDPRGAVQTAFAFNQVFSAVTAATGALNQFLQPYVELDKAVKNIGTLGRQNFEEFATFASKLAAEVPGQAQDAANAYYQIISALGTRADQFTNAQIAKIGEIAAKAAVAGQTTTDVAADVGTSVLNAYQLEADKTAEIFDVLFAGVKLGKCVVGSTRILQPDGTYKRIDNMSGSNEIVSFDGKKFVPKNSEWIYQGEKPTVKLKTNLGREIVTTWNHPYLTENGWLKVKDLNVGEKIAVPKELPYFGNKEIPEYIAEFLGFWLAEGTRKSSSPSITTNKYGYKAKEWATKFGCKAKQQEKRDGKANVYRFIANDGQGGGNVGKNPVVNLLKEYGLFDIENKFIPEQIYTWDEKSIRTLLKWFFNGDGWLCDLRNSGNSGFQLGYSAKNKDFAESINHLLLRFGIVGRLRYRKQVNCYDWSTNRYSEIKRFIDKIGIDRDDLKLFNDYKPQHQRPLKETVLFDKIIEIEATGIKEKVYDLTVPELHNFVANDIIAHNTSFDEIGEALPNFVSAASATGTGFDQVTAALASLTAVGIPTAQAGTNLNAVFTLLSKGNANLESALAQSGLTLQDLRDRLKEPVESGGGLINVLNTIRTSVEATGEEFGAKFTGRVQAANAILSLTGKNLQNTTDTYAALQQEVAGGAAEKAFGVAAESISAQTDSILSTVQNKFNVLFSTIGSGATTALNSFVQLAPAVTGLSSALSIIPVKNIFGFLVKTIPPVIIQLGTTIASFLGLTTAETAAGVAGSVAWKSILGPIGLVIGAIGAVVAAVILVIKYWDEIKAVGLGVFEALKAGIKGFVQPFIDAFAAIKEGDILGGLKNIFLGLSPTGIAINFGKNFFGGFKKGFNDSLAKDADTVSEKVAESFSDLEAVEVKIDASEDLDNLVSQYESTQSELEQLKLTPKEDLTAEQIKQIEVLEERLKQTSNTLANIAPDSIVDSKLIVDETGALVEAYDVSIDKVKEFADEQKNSVTGEQEQALQEYSKNIENQIGIYRKQGDEVDKLVKKRNELAESGDLEKAKKLDEDITKAVEAQKATRGQLLDTYKKSLSAGGEELEINKEIQKEFNITEETVQDIKDAQEGVNDELEESKDLSKLFSENMGAAKEAQKQAVNQLAELIRQQKEGNTTTEDGKDINEAINEARADGVKAVKDLKKFTDAQKESEKLLGLETKKTSNTRKKSAKTLYQLENERYQQIVERLNLESESYKLEQETNILANGRTKNSLDDLAIKQQEYASLQAQKKELQEIFKISEDGTVGLNIKEEEKQKVLKQFNGLNLDLQKKANEQTAIKLKLEADETKIQEALKQQRIEDIQANIELGISDETDLLTEFQTQLQGITAELTEYERKVLETKRAITQAQTAGLTDVATSLQADLLSYNEHLNDVRKIYDDYQNEIIDVERTISENLDIELAKRLDAETASAKAKLDLENEQAKKRQDILNAFYLKALDDRNESELEKLDKQEQAKLDKSKTAQDAEANLLEQQKEKGIITEELYQKRLTQLEQDGEAERLKIEQDAERKRLAAERKAQTDRIIADQLAKGVLIEQERLYQEQQAQIEADRAAKEVSDLQSKQERYNLEIEALRQQKQQADEIEQLEIQRRIERIETEKQINEKELETAGANFDKLNQIVLEKGDLLKTYSSEIQDGISATIGSLFEGDAESAKDGLKGVLAVLAGGLEKQAGAAATSLILGQLGIAGATTGIAGLLLVPAISALVNKGISALLRPVISGLLSFGHGGRVDNPTTAVIGDAKNANGSSTEWVMNERNFQTLTDMQSKKTARAVQMAMDKKEALKSYQIFESHNITNAISDSKDTNSNSSMVKQLNAMAKENAQISKELRIANEQRQLANETREMQRRLQVKGLDGTTNNFIPYEEREKVRKRKARRIR